MSAHSHSHVNVSSKSGPARMATTQDEFRKAVERRFRAFRGAIRESLSEDDFLRLKQRNTGRSPRDIANQPPPIEAPEPYEFGTGAREEQFTDWVRATLRASVVEELDLDDVREGMHWTSGHVDTGYQTGLRWSDARLKEFGIEPDGAQVGGIARRPVHRDALRTLYTRTYDELDNIGTDAARRVGSVLSDSLAEGVGPEEAARRLTDEVSTIQRTRGRRLARTEIMNAHAQATGNRYEQMGVEWANIATSAPCDQCLSFREAGPHEVGDVVAALPLHPNCVCAMVPARNDDDPLTSNWT